MNIIDIALLTCVSVLLLLQSRQTAQLMPAVRMHAVPSLHGHQMGVLPPSPPPPQQQLRPP